MDNKSVSAGYYLVGTSFLLASVASVISVADVA